MLKFPHPGLWPHGNYIGLYYINTYPDPNREGYLSSSETVNTCREYFVKQYRTLINAQHKHSAQVKKAYALISYGKPRSPDLKDLNDILLKESQKSLYIINSFEKIHKWPLTKLYPVKCLSNRVSLVFFSGSRKWTMSPYLMSIWSLCIRLGRNKWLPKGVLTLNHSNLIRQLLIKARSAGSNMDAYQILHTMREWDTFMSLYHKLFAGVDRKEHWNTDHLHGQADRPEGIKRLMDGSTNYKELYEKYNSLVNKGKTNG